MCVVCCVLFVVCYVLFVVVGCCCCLSCGVCWLSSLRVVCCALVASCLLSAVWFVVSDVRLGVSLCDAGCLLLVVN